MINKLYFFVKMKTICSLYGLLFGLILISSICKCEKVKPTKTVTTLLDAKWQSTPILLEACEFLSDEREDYFCKFIDSICEYDQDFLKKRSDKETYDLILKEAGAIISPSKINVLKFSLSLRTYSPKVEMFHQLSYSQNLPSGCATVIEINSMFTCDLMDIEKLIKTAPNRTKGFVYKLDHHYINTGSSNILTVLYGELGSDSFREFHFILSKYAKEGKFDYIIRHYLPKRNDKKVRLSGYGVELSIKSTEYKAQDDRKIKADGPTDVEEDDNQDEIEGFVFSKLKKLHPELKGNLDRFQSYLIGNTNEMAALKVWQIQDLSLQAAERIMSSPIEETLRILRDISQNFPIQARSLVKTVVKEELKKEISKNQNMFSQNHNLAATDTALFINGIYFDLEVSDIFGILNTIRQELRTMEELHRIGVQEEHLSKILKLDLGALKQEYAIDIRDSSIQYVNDIENDRQYSSWPSSISELLRPTYPGMLRSIRKNIFHLVFIVDPCHESSKDLLKLAESFYIHRAPIRIGLLFAVNRNSSTSGFEDCGVAMLNAFNFVSQEKESVYQGLSFITDVYAGGSNKNMESSDIIKVFKTKYPREDLDLIFGEDSDYDTGRKLTEEFLDRCGLNNFPEVVLNGVRLEKKYLNSDFFEEAVLTEIMQQTSVLQKAVYKGLLSDSLTALDYVMSLPNVMPRINNHILNDTWKLLDMTGVPLINFTPQKFAELSTTDMAATVMAHLKYLTARDDNSFRPITTWIIADLETEEGSSLYLNALEHMKSSNDVRLGIIFNSKTMPSDAIPNHLSKAVFTALQLLNKKEAATAIEKIFKPNNIASFRSGEKSLLDLAEDLNKEKYTSSMLLGKDIIKIHQRFCKRVLGFQPGQRGVISNGRIIGPFDFEETFIFEDFNLLEKHSLSIYGEKLRNIFQDINNEGELDSISDLSMRVSSLILGTQSPARVELKYRSADYSVIKIPPKTIGQPVFDIKVIVDPVSKGAQKAAPVLMVLQEILNANIWIFLNSQDKLSDMPLKSFYRYIIEPEIQFVDGDSISSGPIAKFTNMPTSPLLTLQLNTPENWLVESMRTPFDLDNIRLEDVSTVVWSEFELEYLLVEGHCFDQATGNPPRGLQFTLGTKLNPVMVDTIVMANLGYFQLKANPGAWILNLRQGRSSNLYDIKSHEGTDSPPGVSDVHILINSFRSNIIKIKVSKKPEKQHLDLLSDEEDEEEETQKNGIWNSISKKPVEGIVGVVKKFWDMITIRTFSRNKVDDDVDDEINIFSLASGHLYERLLRIMMLSVLKNTKVPVKFWFLKNYLSPDFKNFLPYLAKHYNFKYELVQYKWPRWLHQQTEKQRTIWGYKILFLDVLFPLHVKKFIFVDADQVVRADMRELQTLDLGGAPYGYTPFCESRKDMDGYRFWKSGYWASHLQGRRYHISALYVVDLKKFRKIAAGDRLRGQYQGLSQDPNSLSNLDQDLPNNMIHQVYIKSLPQEWLWCETWCDNASKEYAKTIDLCNNPQTKESKLTSAMRIIPEWKSYDDEIRDLLNQFKENKTETDNGTNDIPKDSKSKLPKKQEL